MRRMFLPILFILFNFCVFSVEELIFNPEFQINSSTGPTANTSTDPYLALNNSGQAVVVWRANGNVYASTRDILGNWSNPFQINASSGGSSGKVTSFPWVAINSSGEALALWTSAVDPDEDDIGNVYVASRDSNGNWSNEQQINSPTGPTANISRSHTVSINDSGEAVAIWSTDVLTDTNNIYAASRNSKGVWASEQRINASSGGSANASETPFAAINNSGQAVACWYTEVSENGFGNVYVSSRDANDNWSNELQVNSSSGPTANSSKLPLIAFNNSGQAVVAWYTEVTVDASGNIYAVSRDTKGKWSKEQQINASSGGSANIAIFPFVSLNDSGESVVSWFTSKKREVTGNVYVASRDSNGNWSNEQQINSPTGPTENISAIPTSAINSSGEAVVAWFTDISGTLEGTGNIYVASRDSNGNWSNEQQINSPTGPTADNSSFALTSINDSGLVIVNWVTPKINGENIYGIESSSKGNSVDQLYNFSKTTNQLHIQKGAL